MLSYVPLSASCCQICGCESSSWHYGAMACEACKKFFIRSHNDSRFLNYACVQTHGKCKITLTTRSSCQSCRWEKCRRMGMCMKASSESEFENRRSDNQDQNLLPTHVASASTRNFDDVVQRAHELSVDWLIKTTLCAVCSSKSSGVHFGVITCEACKAFFRRSLKRHTTYKCMSASTAGSSGSCLISSGNRSCRSCRFAKCVQVGMASENCKVGRKSNVTKQQLCESKRRFEQLQEQGESNECREDFHDEEYEERTKQMRFDDSQVTNATTSSASFSSSSGIDYSNRAYYHYFNTTTAYHQYYTGAATTTFPSYWSAF